MAINAGPKFWANIQAEPKRKYRFVLKNPIDIVYKNSYLHCI